MAELVDALVSGTSIRKYVQVRVLFWAQSDRHTLKKFYLPRWQGQPLINDPVDHFREEPARGKANSAFHLRKEIGELNIKFLFY
jgi:hypothetical protein